MCHIWYCLRARWFSGFCFYLVWGEEGKRKVRTVPSSRLIISIKNSDFLSDFLLETCRFLFNAAKWREILNDKDCSRILYDYYILKRVYLFINQKR